MKCRKLQPQHHGWIESILDKEFVDFLWGRIEKSEHDVKDRLAGNISTSLAITDDEDETFFNQVLFPQVEMYREMNHGRDPIEVANLVSKIIKEKKPKINYLVGGFLEKKITLKSLLPDKLFQKIIMKLYS